MLLHVNHGGDAESNHFLYNDREIGWLWMSHPDSLLCDKARLHLARATHMLKPYFPHSRYREVGLSRVGENVPRKRFSNITCIYGGNHTAMEDYASKAEGSPE